MKPHVRVGHDGCQILYPRDSERARRVEAVVRGLDGHSDRQPPRPPVILWWLTLLSAWCCLCLAIVVVGNWMLEGVRILLDVFSFTEGGP